MNVIGVLGGGVVNDRLCVRPRCVFMRAVWGPWGSDEAGRPEGNSFAISRKNFQSSLKIHRVIMCILMHS